MELILIHNYSKSDITNSVMMRPSPVEMYTNKNSSVNICPCFQALRHLLQNTLIFINLLHIIIGVMSMAIKA